MTVPLVLALGLLLGVPVSAGSATWTSSSSGLEIVSEAPERRGDGQFGVGVRNEGDRWVGPAELGVIVDQRLSLRVSPDYESCGVRARGLVVCSISGLDPGDSYWYLVEVRPRVATWRDGILQAVPVRLEARPSADPLELAVTFAGCSDEDPGHGTVVGSPWNDVICGRSGADRLTGGAGRDTLHGGRGNDLMLIRDGSRDLAACGPGRDRVVADRSDRVARDCERVARR